MVDKKLGFSTFLQGITQQRLTGAAKKDVARLDVLSDVWLLDVEMFRQKKESVDLFVRLSDSIKTLQNKKSLMNYHRTLVRHHQGPWFCWNCHLGKQIARLFVGPQHTAFWHVLIGKSHRPSVQTFRNWIQRVAMHHLLRVDVAHSIGHLCIKTIPISKPTASQAFYWKTIRNRPARSIPRPEGVEKYPSAGTSFQWSTFLQLLVCLLHWWIS